MSADDPAMTGDIDERAAAWYSRARSGAMGREDEAAFEAWLEEDPAHRAAYDAVERAWSALDLIRAHPRMLAMRDELPPERPRRMRRALPRWAVAACLAVMVAGASVGGWLAFRPEALLETRTWRTGAGQRAVLTLPDGSEVTLNSGAVLRTRADKDRRLIYLDRGQAFFRVAKDKEHPFVVRAAGRRITALGTAFDVRVEPSQFSVTLVEGKVRVEAPGPAPAPGGEGTGPAAPVEATEMVAGSQLVALDARRWSVARTDVQAATRWVRDQLVFESQPLAEVAAQMNRRSVRQIVIADPQVGEILVSGNFRPGDVDGFARAVQAYDYAKITSESDGRIELSAR